MKNYLAKRVITLGLMILGIHFNVWAREERATNEFRDQGVQVVYPVQGSYWSKVVPAKVWEYFGWPTIIQEIEAGNLEGVKNIVEYDPTRLNALHKSGISALMYAIQRQKWDIAYYIVSRGADIQYSANGWTALEEACHSIHTEEDVSKGVDLIWLILNTKVDGRGLKVEALERLTHTLVEYEDLESIKRFAQANSDILNIKNEDKDSVLMYAIQLRRWEIAEYLVSQKTDVKYTKLNGRDALYEICDQDNSDSESDLEASLKLMRQIVNRGVVINKNRIHALKACVVRSNLEGVKELIRLGANPLWDRSETILQEALDNVLANEDIGQNCDCQRIKDQIAIYHLLLKFYGRK